MFQLLSFWTAKSGFSDTGVDPSQHGFVGVVITLVQSRALGTERRSCSGISTSIISIFLPQLSMPEYNTQKVINLE